MDCALCIMHYELCIMNYALCIMHCHALLKHSLFNAGADALYHGIVLVRAGVEPLAHVHTEEAPKGLPKTGTESAKESLNDVVTALVSLSINKFD